MDSYADSSFLVSLIGEDANTAAARRWMSRQTEPLPFNPLHRLEVRNAFRLAVKLGRITRRQRSEALEEIEVDLREGFLVPVAIPWTEIMRRAETLSAKNTEILGNRAADIMHVAAALESGAETLLSFDLVQRALAKAEGLTVKP